MISLGLHVLDDLLPGPGHHQAGQVGLHADHLDVHEVPGDGLEDLELRPLDVEDEPVNGGITQSQEESVERKTLESDGLGSLLLPTLSVSSVIQPTSPPLYQDNSSHGPDIVLAVQHGRGVPVEVNIVRPGLGGQTVGAHCGSPGLEVEARRDGLHQQPRPALGQLEVETV